MKKCSRLQSNTVSNLIGIKPIAVMIISLLILSYGLIGGCNNNSSGQIADALQVGELSGSVVPAVDAEFFLKEWQEGDSDNNFFLQGSTVSELTQDQEDALNNAYQSGFFISLISPDIQEIQELHDVLGLRKLIVNTGPLDLFAVSKEFNVSGVRYFRLHSLPDDGIPTELEFERERVERLIAWQNMQSTATTSVREDASPEKDLTMLADSVSYTELLSIKSGQTLGTGLNTIRPSDFEGHFQGFVQGWSVHSVEANKDFYFYQLQYELAPNTNLKSSPTAGWPCNPIVAELLLPPNDNQRGVNNYQTDNIVAGLLMPPVVSLIESKPLTTEGVDTTESSVSRSISGDVSYSQEEGASVGLSDGVTYEKSESYSSPAVTTMNLSLDGPQGNNAAWTFSVFGANAATATFQPLGQWVWEAGPETRQEPDALPCTIDKEEEFCIQFQMNILVNFYPISCLGTVPPVGMSDGWSFNFPVPPTPPPPTPMPTPTPMSTPTPAP